MDLARIAELLQPFFQSEAPPGLAPFQLQHISTYVDLLLRWNARINLTAVRQPEEIVTRHFGESLFAARHLFPAPAAAGPARVVDVGSGAGFPGLPVKLWAPAIHLTLIESSHKKATFLREIIRSLTLTNVDVFTGRAQDFSPGLADVVTLRAVERFADILPAACRLLAPSGRLALLIGQAQVEPAHALAPGLHWQAPVSIPLSSSRVLLIADSA